MTNQTYDSYSSPLKHLGAVIDTDHDAGEITATAVISAIIEDKTNALKHFMIDIVGTKNVVNDGSLTENIYISMSLPLRIEIDQIEREINATGLLKNIAQYIDELLITSYGADIAETKPWATSIHIGELIDSNELNILNMLQPPDVRMPAIKRLIADVMSQSVYNEKNPLLIPRERVEATAA